LIEGGDFMRKSAILIVLVGISIASASVSEPVEIQLPELIGSYSSTMTNRLCAFVLSAAPSEVDSVWIHFSGSVTVGERYCYIGGTPPPVGPDPVPMEFIVYMDDTVSGETWWAHCLTELESGSFDFTLLFEAAPNEEPTWEFIILGGGTVDFNAIPPAIIPDCWYEVFPEATIEEATLIINGEFPIAAETYTWGSIKTLFK
jgi:hypothetical protein